MGRFRARAACATVVIAGGLAMTLRGQVADVSRLQILQNVGLTAVDEGVIADQSHLSGSPGSLRRAAFHPTLEQAAPVTAVAGYRPGRILVRFRDEASALERRAAVRSASGTAEIGARPSYADFDVVQLDPSEDAMAAARLLSQRPEVQYAQVAHHVRANLVPNDPLYSMQWNLPMLNLEKAWDIQPAAGSTITVAVIDTGMAYQNATITATIPAFRDDRGVRYPALGTVTIPYSAAPQLVTAANTGRIVMPFDFVTDGARPPLDFDGHGTHVSGTIGQLTNDGIGTAGVAFNVKLMPLKALASDWDVLFGSATDVGGFDDDIARALHYAADNGAKIINMSLGSSGPANCATNANQPECSPVIEAAMRYAVGKGCFITVAGGNEFEDNVPPFGTNPTSILAEIASRVPGVVSVASVNRGKDHAFYSSTGTYIELSAPGGDVRGFGLAGAIYQQTFDPNFTDTFLLPPAQYHAPRFDVMGFIPYQGTSMAAPHVAGVAAMLMQQGVTDPAVIEQILENTAVDLGAAGRDNTFGFGLVDARAALRGLGLAK
jgi:serine protease